MAGVIGRNIDGCGGNGIFCFGLWVCFLIKMVIGSMTRELFTHPLMSVFIEPCYSKGVFEEK
jgi:hypothetical protein